MSDRFISIKITKQTKERIDALAKFSGFPIISVVDDAITFFQYRLLKSFPNSTLKKACERYEDEIKIARMLNEKFLKEQRGEKDEP